MMPMLMLMLTDADADAIAPQAPQAVDRVNRFDSHRTHYIYELQSNLQLELELSAVAYRSAIPTT